MAAGILAFTGPLAIKTNADFNFALTCTASSTGNPIDFTGYNAKMSIGYYAPGADCEQPVLIIVYTLTSEGDTPTITFPTPTSGVIQLNIPEAITSTFTTLLTGSYDLLLLPPGGAIEEFLQGPIQILSGITVAS